MEVPLAGGLFYLTPFNRVTSGCYCGLARRDTGMTNSLVFACNCLKDIKEPDCNNSPPVTILHFYSTREESRKWYHSKDISKESRS